MEINVTTKETIVKKVTEEKSSILFGVVIVAMVVVVLYYALPVVFGWIAYLILFAWLVALISATKKQWSEHDHIGYTNVQSLRLTQLDTAEKDLGGKNHKRAEEAIKAIKEKSDQDIVNESALFLLAFATLVFFLSVFLGGYSCKTGYDIYSMHIFVRIVAIVNMVRAFQIAYSGYRFYYENAGEDEVKEFTLWKRTLAFLLRMFTAIAVLFVLYIKMFG